MVNVEFFNTSTTSIILQNVLGERLAEVTYSDKGTINTQFDLSNFAKGIYFIHFKTINNDCFRATYVATSDRFRK